MIDKTRVLRGRLGVLRDKLKGGDATGDMVVPWWVDVLTNWGRPVVAAVVLAMCSPGEHYLAREAGFPRVNPLGLFTVDLAWGMPFVLTAYAGISAVVATKRPKGSPGKRTAVAGAILSILLAMTAQPVAHLYGRPGGLMGEWDTAKTLIVITSCIPALVLGHLLHLAVSHVPARLSRAVPEDKDTTRAGEDKDTGTVPEDTQLDVPVSPGTQWVFEDRTYRAGVPVPAGDKDRDKAVSSIAKAFDVPEDILTAHPGTAPDRDTRTGQPDVPGDTAPVRPPWMYDEDGVVPGYREDTGDTMSWSPPSGESRRTARDDLSSRRKLTDVIKDIRQDVGDDPDTIKDGVLATPGFEDMRSTPQKRNTLNTAVRRALAKTA